MRILTVTPYLLSFFAISIALNLELNDQWKLYMKIYNKTYENPFHELIRRMIWEDNLKYIHKHNLDHDLGLYTFTLGINQFADLTHAEFKAIYLSGNLRPNKTGNTYLPPLNAFNVPANVDWTEKGYVTDVKDQGKCGSCWAFSATGSLEGQFFRKTGRLVSFSEQQLVDCSKSNNGCNGGLMTSAFNDIKDLGGIESEQEYPYKAQQLNCEFNHSKVVTSVSGYKEIDENEGSLAIAVANEGPISVGISVSLNFQLYKSGVYNEPDCSRVPNHGVLVVGYGTSVNDNYWIVKNSWGPLWGMKGYIWMSKDKDNQCAIASFASFPVI